MNQVLPSRSWAKSPQRSASELGQLVGKAIELDRIIASHSNVSSDALVVLSRSSDKTTRRYVALNPNTPKPALIDLAAQFPGEFFRNPVFELLLFEDPQLLFNMGHGVLSNIMKRRDCPASFLAWAVEHGDEDQKLAVAMNPETTEQLLSRLVRQGGRPGEAASMHTKLGPISSLAQAEQAFQDSVKKALSLLSIKEAQAMWRKGAIGPPQWLWLKPEVRLAVPGRERGMIPKEFALPELERAASQSVTPSGSHYRALDMDFEANSKDPYPETRIRAAGSLLAPLSVIERLAGDKNSEVRFVVAGNPNAPLEVLRMLASDESRLDPWGDERVKDGVASNPAAPSELLEKLSQEPSKATRLALAKNPSTPLKVLHRFAQLKDDEIMGAIAANTGCPRTIKQLSAAIRWRHDFLKLAKTFEVDAQTVLPSVPTDDALIEVFRLECQLVIESPEKSLIGKLIQSNEHQVLFLHPEHIRSACRSQLEILKLRGLRHPAADPLELVKSHNSTDWRMRLAIAGNGSAPQSILEKLAEDTNQHVVIQATSTLLLKTKGHEKRDEVLPAKRTLCLAQLAQEVCDRLNATYIDNSVTLFDEPWWSRLTFSQKHSRHRQWLAPYDEYLSEILLAPNVTLSLAKHSRDVFIWPSDQPSPNLFHILNTLSESKLDEDRLTVATYKHAPVEVLERLAKDRSTKVREAVAANQSTPPETLMRFSHLSSVDIRSAVAGNVTTPGSTLQSLAKGAAIRLSNMLVEGSKNQVLAYEEARVMANVAENPSASAELRLETIECMAEHESFWARHFAAEAQACPTALLDKLCNDPEQLVRKAVAANAAAPPALLSQLSKDTDLEVRRRVASNPSTPTQVLCILAKDSDRTIRVAVGRNPSCPEEAGTYLSMCQCNETLVALANNVSTGEATLKEVLLLLASSEDKFDRRAAASNRLASYDVLARLSCDIDFEVLSALLDNESCPMDLKASVAVRIADSPRLDAKVFAANRPETPTAALGRLAQSDDETILVGVVANASTSNELRIELLKKLWKSNNVLIRQAVASNASTPEPILLSMAARDFWPVRASAISNPCFPEKLRAKARDSLKQEVLKSLEPPRPLAAEELRPEHFHEPLMVLGLMPPLDEKNAVSKAVKAKDWVQRAAACLSPSISESALKRLLDDEVEMVKELAVWRLQEASKTA